MKFFYTIISLILISSSLYSQVGGNQTYKFLNFPISSRIAALGGNNVSHYDADLSMITHNPSFLSSSMSDKLFINYVNYVSDINFANLAYAKNFNKIGCLAFNLQYQNYGKYYHTNELGEILKNFSANEYALSVSHVRKLFDNINIGANFKTIFSDFYLYKSFGLALDLGFNYIDTAKLFSAGLVFKNAGFQIKPYHPEHREALAFDIQLGITKKFTHAPICLSFTMYNLCEWNLKYSSPFNNNTEVSDTSMKKITKFFNKVGNVGDEIMRHCILSLEIIPHKNFYISLGYNFRRRSELAIINKSKLVGTSIGFGLKLSKFNINYSLASYHLSGTSHHIGLGINIAEFYKKN